MLKVALSAMADMIAAVAMAVAPEAPGLHCGPLTESRPGSSP